jgi:lactate dehydrogenase-like 2-hydroxyacid dehydrogenase
MPDPVVKILSIGEMDRRDLEALAKHFVLYRANVLGLENILRSVGPQVRGMVARSHPVRDELLRELPALELLAQFGVGYDSIDVAAAAKRGVIVTNTPDVLDGEMADFAVGLLLATVRRLPQADRLVRSGRWSESEKFPLSTSLRERSIGIAGMGRIGKVIARRLEGFDLPIAYFGRQPQPGVEYPFYADLKELARAVDTLLVVLPGGPETSRMVDAEVLAALGPNGILINVARGSVVDEPALIRALQSRIILAAGLDVYEHEPNISPELLEMQQVVLLPHIGTATRFTRDRMGDLLVENVRSWFSGKGPVTPVKETPWPPM